METKDKSVEGLKDIEIERKYLVNEDKWAEIETRLDGFDYVDIDQGYDPSGLRIRRSIAKSGKTKYVLTDKSHILGANGMVRSEKETVLSEPQFRILWPATEGIRVIKRRYFVPLEEGLIAHLDIFSNPDEIKNKKLIEVEFPNLDAANKFLGHEPEWFGGEVTEKTTNHQLALGASFPSR